MAQITPQANDFEAFDDIENIGSNPEPKTPIAEIIEARYGRRGLLSSAAALATLSAALPGTAKAQTAVPVSGGPSSLTFSEPPRALAQRGRGLPELPPDRLRRASRPVRAPRAR